MTTVAHHFKPDSCRCRPSPSLAAGYLRTSADSLIADGTITTEWPLIFAGFSRAAVQVCSPAAVQNVLCNRFPKPTLLTRVLFLNRACTVFCVHLSQVVGNVTFGFVALCWRVVFFPPASFLLRLFGLEVDRYCQCCCIHVPRVPATDKRGAWALLWQGCQPQRPASHPSPSSADGSWPLFSAPAQVFSLLYPHSYFHGRHRSRAIARRICHSSISRAGASRIVSQFLRDNSEV